MILQLTPIGEILGKTIHHGCVHLDFEDYNNLFLKTRGKKPISIEVYTASQEKGEDYMLGFDFLWKEDNGDLKTERMSFKDFWDYFDKNWDWKNNSKTFHHHKRNEDGSINWDIELEPYTCLDLKYTEVCFQTHQAGGCCFDRVHNRVTGYGYDIEKGKQYLENFKKNCGFY